jgi:hypothetical protein
MESKGGYDLSRSIKNAGKAAGHNVMTIQRARARLKLRDGSVGFPRRTYWWVPGTELPEELKVLS